MQFAKKKVAILGLSTEGGDSARFFTASGAHVFCCDKRTQQELGQLYDALTPLRPQFILGENYLKNLTQYDLIVRTPGMNLHLPELLAAQEAGIPITSSTKLFMELVKGTVIGVTGTKGKGTTATLIAAILKAHGFTTYLGGNVGTPLLSQVHSIAKDAFVVLELSSFQLEDVTKSPHIAVILGITSEHLANFDASATNYHESRKAYVQAKENLVRFQTSRDYCVLNFDDETSRSFATYSAAQKYYFSTEKVSQGVFIKNDRFVWITDKTVTEICSVFDTPLLGVHQRENLAAAITVAVLVGVAPVTIKSVIKKYTGLEHRLEYVATKNGVEFYNDSAATVPEATIAAIAAFDKPLILIAGGSDKGADLTQLGQKIVKSTVKTLILIGAMSEKIHEAVEQVLIDYPTRKLTVLKNLTSMKQIVETAYKNAKPKDVVLLSPSCASFGMFQNYRERGQLFKKYVKQIA